MYKLLLLSAIAVSAVVAHPGHHLESRATVATDFKFSETFPASGSIPTAKPEWLELIKNVNITAAPVYHPAPGQDPQPEVPGQDPYCDWTFTGCVRDDDLFQCPKGQWALTYDDGPSEFSPKLYDFLDKQNVKVTFFMVGGQVVKFPDYVKRAYNSGHEIAMHTWSHNFMTTLTNEQIVAELKWNELAIKEVIGVSPKYFRPPYGDIDDRVRQVAAALGFIPVIWNHDTNDWAAGSDPKFNTASITKTATEWAAKAKTASVGGMSLEHDLYEQTVAIAINILPILKKAYTLTPVGTCNNVNMYINSTATPSVVSSIASSSTLASSSVSTTSTPATLSKAAVTTSGASSFSQSVNVGLGIMLVAATLF
ncbi:hypothetical protein BDB01DRAFT_315065 [Pilobolus umbonatus]|nr:hypothetical protein BDB01DRAFT_315065 [Pilobolus umbonatus]